MNTSLSCLHPARVLVLSALLGLACSPQPERWRPDVVLIVLDTTRADALGPYSDQDGVVTPFFDGLAEQSLVFHNAWTASTCTAPSTASILTGLMPTRHGIELNMTVQAAENWRLEDDTFEAPTYEELQAVELVALSSSISTLGEHLQRAGYQTIGVGANMNVCDEVGLTRGFDLIDVDSDRSADEMSATLARLQEDQTGDSPTFTYLHYMDPHAPYLSKAPLCPPDNGRKYNARQRYRSEVTFLDRELGALIEREGWLEDTLLVIVSDHGEEFRDHGDWMHRYSVHQELSKAAMIWKMPGLSSGTTNQPAHHIDVVPSILSLLDLPPPVEMDGRPLFLAQDDGSVVLDPGQEERALLTFRTERRNGPCLWALTLGDWRYLEEVPSGEASLYNLRKDPKEQHDRLDELPERATRMHRTLRRLRDDLKPIPGEDVTVDLTRSMAQKLRTLGYVGPSDDASPAGQAGLIEASAPIEQDGQ